MPEEATGPWIYHDPDARKYLVQIVPMEQDSGLADDLQPNGLVFQTETGWIRVTPVGHDFDPQELGDAEMFKILQLASGRPTSS